MATKHPAQGTIDAQTAIANAMTEDELLANVKDAALKFGWLFYHTHDARRSDEGFPDVVMVRDSEIIFAELKRESGQIRPSQKYWIAALRDTAELNTGVWAGVWRPSNWMAGDIERALR